MGKPEQATRSLSVAKAEAADKRWWANAEQTDGCWLWQGSVNADGYGTIWNGERNRLAHRYGYEMLVGPIPAGMELEHVCTTRLCVKPTHLSVATHATNMGHLAPRNLCKNGHPLVPGNVYRYPSSGARLCVTCHPERRPNWFPDGVPA